MLAGVHDELALDGAHAVLLVLREQLVPNTESHRYTSNSARINYSKISLYFYLSRFVS